MCRLMSYFDSLQGCVGSCLTLTGCRDVSAHVSCLVAGMCWLMSYFDWLQGCVSSCLTYFDWLQGCVGSCLTLTGCRDVSAHVLL